MAFRFPTCELDLKRRETASAGYQSYNGHPVGDYLFASFFFWVSCARRTLWFIAANATSKPGKQPGDQDDTLAEPCDNLFALQYWRTAGVDPSQYSTPQYRVQHATWLCEYH